jgi:multimeric flavodoxin WrbA
MMKIVCLLGSPRTKGNSSTLAQHFCGAAEKLGAKVETYALNKLNFRGCQACMACKTKLDKCILKDDLEAVLDSIRDADVLVLSTPVYFADLTAQLKAFIDRTYSYLVPNFYNNPNPSRLSPGKKLVFIQTQGQPNEKLFADIFPRNEAFLKWYGFKDTYLIRACGVRNPEDILAKNEVLKQAEEVAKKIAG